MTQEELDEVPLGFHWCRVNTGEWQPCEVISGTISKDVYLIGSDKPFYLSLLETIDPKELRR